MKTLIRRSAEVFLAPQPISSIGAAEIALLTEALEAAPRGRVRINLHPDVSDLLHEMIIALRRDSYIHPHKHHGKSETFHLIAGDVDIIVFEDDGRLKQIIPLSANAEIGARCYRMSQPFFHTLRIKTPILVVHEITNGPFVAGGAELASFAPPETDAKGVKEFQRQLDAQLTSFEPLDD